MDDYSDEFSQDDQKTPMRPAKSIISPRPKGKKGKQKKYYSAGINTGKKKTNKGQEGAVEYWSDTLRRTGHGISTESTASSFSGLKKSQSGNMAYHSTSHYLRRAAGTESSKKNVAGDSLSKHTPGTPAYKSQEEYYDEIMEMKKVIKSLEKENSTMKSKLRRLEEDNLKKEREIEQLLDPSKSEELRRTLADRKPDTGAVIHSHKQKILKLEQQLKDKDAAYTKIQCDLKTTKVEEMKIQVEYFYKEILRLNQLKSVDSPIRKKETTLKESPTKLKALQEMIKRMNEKNIRMQTENQTLKKDLGKMLEDKEATKTRKGEYENMSKSDLINIITKLERRLNRAEGDTSSLISELDSRQGLTQGKIRLEGSLEQKLHQLDQRETELLEELEKKQQMNKRLKDDRVHYRQKADEKDMEIKRLKKAVEELSADLDGNKDKRGRSRSPRSQSTIAHAEQKGSFIREKSPRQRSRSRSASMSASERERMRQVELFRENHAAKSIQREWKQHRQRQDNEERKVEDIKQKHAARVIQKYWKNYNKNKLMEEEQNAAEMIQSAMRGHSSRRSTVERMRGYYVGSDEELVNTNRHSPRQIQRRPIQDSATDVTETELEEAAELIQASFRGHKYQKGSIKSTQRILDSDSELDDAAELIQSSFLGHRSRKNFLASKTDSKYISDDSELDDAVEVIQGTFQAHLNRKSFIHEDSQRSKTPPRSSSRASNHYSPRHLDSAGEEDESDEVMSTMQSRGNRSGRTSPFARTNANRRSPSPNTQYLRAGSPGTLPKRAPSPAYSRSQSPGYGREPSPRQGRKKTKPLLESESDNLTDDGKFF